MLIELYFSVFGTDVHIGSKSFPQHNSKFEYVKLFHWI